MLRRFCNWAIGRFSSPGRPHVGLSAIILSAFILVAECSAEAILDERLLDDPISTGRATIDGASARFNFQSGSLLARYDTAQPTAKLSWLLGQTLTQATDFSFSFDYTVRGGTLDAADDAFAQLSFGLTNSNATGNDRAGGTRGDAFDIVTFDYFPNVSPAFGGPTLAPTVIETRRPGDDFFNHIQFSFGAESLLSDDGETPLPADVHLTAHVTYAAADQLLTLQVLGPDGLLPINQIGGQLAEVGGGDGDVTTIELFMPPSVQFSVDSASILLWQDTFAPPGESTVKADLDFLAIRVFDEIVPPTSVPEPTSGVLAIVALIALLGTSARGAGRGGDSKRGSAVRQ